MMLHPARQFTRHCRRLFGGCRRVNDHMPQRPGDIFLPLFLRMFVKGIRVIRHKRHVGVGAILDQFQHQIDHLIRQRF